jgi:hypothetical protein
MVSIHESLGFENLMRQAILFEHIFKHPSNISLSAWIWIVNHLNNPLREIHSSYVDKREIFLISQFILQLFKLVVFANLILILIFFWFLLDEQNTWRLFECFLPHASFAHSKKPWIVLLLNNWL